MSFMSFHDVWQCLISLSTPSPSLPSFIYCLAFKCKQCSPLSRKQVNAFILSDRALMTLYAKAILLGPNLVPFFRHRGK